MFERIRLTKDILQTLAKIVTISQRQMFIDHNIDFDIQLITCMIRLQPLNTLNTLGEAHRHVKQNVALISRRTRAR
jgi:hypothetical protein